METSGIGLRSPTLSLVVCTAGLLVSGCAGNPTTDEVTCIRIKELQTRAEAGDANAQFHVGNLYDGSTPCLPDDRVKRIEWYGKAANQGHAKSLVRLADYYLHGWGVSQDVDQAASLYRNAAAQGEVEAMRKLGNMYHSGKLVPKDLAEAENWYLEAAARGDPFSARTLAEILKSKDTEGRIANVQQLAEIKERYQERKGRLMEEENTRILESAGRLFGRIAVVFPAVGSDADAPVVLTEGMRYKGLKAIGSIPGSIAVYGPAGVLIAPFMPFAVLSAPSKRKVHELQEKVTAAYKPYASENLLKELQGQMVRQMVEKLPNPVAAPKLPQRSGSPDYGELGDTDSVLEVGSIIAGLSLADAEHERAVFLIAIKYRVVKTKGNVVIGEGEVFDRSPQRELAAWTADNGALIGQATSRAYLNIAKETVNELLELADRWDSDSPVSNSE